MTEIMSCVIGFVIGVYLTISVGVFGAGVIDAMPNGYTTVKSLPRCYDEHSRLVLIFQAYRFGCYLGSPVSSVCYDYISCKELEND